MKHIGKWSLIEKEGTKLSIILSGWEVEMWSIMVELDSVPRISLDTNCHKSKYSIKLHHWLSIW